MPYGQPEYKATKTLLKFLTGFVPGLAAIPIATMPEDLETLKASWPMLVIPMATGLYSAGRNIWKNRHKINANLGWCIAILLIPAFMVGACTTTTTTLTYPDGTVEVIEEREFDAQAWAEIMAAAEELQRMAQEYRERQDRLDAEERAREEERIREQWERVQELIRIYRGEQEPADPASGVKMVPLPHVVEMSASMDIQHDTIILWE